MGWESEYENWRDSFHVGGCNEEMEYKQNEYYAKSKKKYEMAKKENYLITAYDEGCCDACKECEHLHSIGMRDAEDDTGLMYCDNKNCSFGLKYRKENETR